MNWQTVSSNTVPSTSVSTRVHPVMIIYTDISCIIS